MHPLFKRILVFLILISGLFLFTFFRSKPTDDILAFTVNPRTHSVQFFWKNDKGEPLQSIQKLKEYVEEKNARLLFATNGGMFDHDLSPHGLFIQNNIKQKELDGGHGQGNFYLLPNGVFYITDDLTAVICKTTDFKEQSTIRYATQSGPMLVVDGQIHTAFKEGSTNLNIRNGVGILPDHKIVFAMSKHPINFYDFARYFQKLGCTQALYLDGFVSRTYWPEGNWMQTDGNFGVMIGITDKPIVP
jgi:uncharacterized protein YigE (DUF2233 family)